MPSHSHQRSCHGTDSSGGEKRANKRARLEEEAGAGKVQGAQGRRTGRGEGRSPGTTEPLLKDWDI